MSTLIPPTRSEKLAAFNPDLPLEKAHTIPSFWYFDPDLYDLERTAVFGANWLAAARTDQLKDPGQFVTADLAGEPIVIVRDDRGQLRAFHNVCRHRAAQVVHEPCGHATKLRCHYHGWTYDLAGRLRGVPEFDGVEDFQKKDEGLVPLAVATWGPLVFVHQSMPAIALDDVLAPLPEKTAGLDLGRLHWVDRREYDIACNWKVFVDNYQDGGYHVNTVHPGLAGALDYSQYRTENGPWTTLQSSPLKASDDVKVGSVRTGDRAYYWWIFPNLMINIYQDVMDINIVLPLGPDKCRVLFDFYFADPQSTRFMADSIEVAHQVQLEDLGVCEEVQHGLRSASFDTGRFSVKRETGAYHFHKLLARKLNTSAVK